MLGVNTMFLIKCNNPLCNAPNHEFEFNDPRYKNARSATETESGAYSLKVKCSCGFPNLIWLKGRPVDEVYRV